MIIRHYSYSVTWSDEDQVYIARVAEFESLIATGDTPQKALAEIIEVLGTTLALIGDSQTG